MVCFIDFNLNFVIKNAYFGCFFAFIIYDLINPLKSYIIIFKILKFQCNKFNLKNRINKYLKIILLF